MLHQPADKCVCGEYLVCPTATDNEEMAMVNRLLRDAGFGANRGWRGVQELINHYECRLAHPETGTAGVSLLDDR